MEPESDQNKQTGIDKIDQQGQGQTQERTFKEDDLMFALENLIEKVGSMGLYQRLLFIMMLPFGFCWAFVYFGQMFLTATPQEHWCMVPELAGLDYEMRRFLSIPGAADNMYDHCMMYYANWTAVLETMLPPSPDTPTIPCQNGWEFLYEDIPYETVVSQREWVCGKAHYVPFATAISFLGSIVGSATFGLLADRFGRLPVFFMANMSGFIGGVATVFTNDFWDFAICRFIVGMASDSCFAMLFILILEYVGTNHRTWVANMSIALFFGGGCLVLPWLALWMADWRNLGLVIATPMALSVLIPFIAPESIRWMMTKGKYDDARKVIKRFEKVNGRKIPQETIDDFLLIAKNTKLEKGNIVELVKVPSTRWMLACLVLLCMSCAMVFDVLIRLSENLGLDFFITFTISSATELPSIWLLVLLLDRYGRRKLAFIPLIVAAVMSLGAAFVPRGVASVALAVIARFVTNMSYNTMLQWAPELMPSAVRASGVAMVHVTGFMAAGMSPFVVFSEVVWLGLPLVIATVVAVVGGVAALYLPETMGQPMPQTIDDCKNLINASKSTKKNVNDEEKYT